MKASEGGIDIIGNGLVLYMPSRISSFENQILSLWIHVYGRPGGTAVDDYAIVPQSDLRIVLVSSHKVALGYI